MGEPGVTCVQETWLKGPLKIVLYGYMAGDTPWGTQLLVLVGKKKIKKTSQKFQ